MRAVLISIQPKWVEKIARGQKTVEVRKTKPKLETPFKVYIYCTIGNGVNGDYLVPMERR
jgi:predicted transcriptional regulator